MKRRHFVVASTASLGGLAAMHAHARPCPPSPVSVAGGGQVITACGTGAPAWFTAMGDKTWATVAASATVAAVAPTPFPGGNGQNGVMAAWCGALVDTKRQELVIPAQGGHSDYYGNEVYALALNAAAPAWQRVTNPRYAFGSGSGMDDGSPRSFHGSSQLCYAANVDRSFLAPLIFTAPLGDSSEDVYAFDRSTGSWARKAPVPAGFASSSGTFGGAVYDPASQCIWIVGGTSDHSVSQYNPVTDTHVLHRDLPLSSGYSGTLALAASRRLLVYLGGSAANHNGSFKWLDLSNIAAGWRTATVSGTPPTGYGPGFVWHEPSAAFLGWDGTPATTAIKKLTPPANPSSGAWLWADVAAAPANSITPTPRAAAGTFGRFNIVANLAGSGRDCVVLVNAVSQATYVYKLPAVGV